MMPRSSGLGPTASDRSKAVSGAAERFRWHLAVAVVINAGASSAVPQRGNSGAASQASAAPLDTKVTIKAESITDVPSAIQWCIGAIGQFIPEIEALISDAQPLKKTLAALQKTLDSLKSRDESPTVWVALIDQVWIWNLAGGSHTGSLPLNAPKDARDKFDYLRSVLNDVNQLANILCDPQSCLQNAATARVDSIRAMALAYEAVQKSTVKSPPTTSAEARQKSTSVPTRNSQSSTATVLKKHGWSTPSKAAMGLVGTGAGAALSGSLLFGLSLPANVAIGTALATGGPAVLAGFILMMVAAALLLLAVVIKGRESYVAHPQPMLQN